MNEPPQLPLIVIAGPTASGKSWLGLEVAESVHGEVLGCDSVQVYRHFNLGSAKLRQEEQRGIPHHLIDIVEPEERFTAGDYARLGRAALAGVSGRGRVPIVVGGTGFYLRALIDGLFDEPERLGADWRQEITERERRRPGLAHRFLTRLDREAAGRIHARDVQKVVRAIEVSMSGRPITEQHLSGREALNGYRILRFFLNPPRNELRVRIRERSAGMFRNGLVEEVRSILRQGVSASAKPFESIGYAQALRVLQGELPESAAIDETAVRTGQYAKRQVTWFKREQEMTTVETFGDRPEARAALLGAIQSFLSAR